ncbi:hypothetical protein EKN56_11830 [Limnobaculum zhutongyuii]|uniref:Uncharacterized protein n=1 Tax=Limnobaculum zhutongyuii TaxID=2498113 RepID=A0A411WLC5_9GAMM|nr:hypothetical protein [Limnobaculum zhutongyuii]QBH97023.1 hypothetical protein EKN56_11830 [Limnobaculum zhutongyuii]TQS87427.1 hypothetical protein ELQ32_13980 [Limnobaculum zhutongyuii]
MLVIPKILESQFLIESDLNYEWEKEHCRMYYIEYINDKLSHALWQLNHKSTVGLATALAEWILWRLSLSSNNPFIQEFNEIEAMWAGLISKDYIFDSLYKGKKDSDKVMGPLWVTLKCMEDVRFSYIEGKIFINEKLSALAAIARLVTPESQFFDNWIANCIKKAIVLFPAEYDRAECNDPSERYNSSHELPIPREFFFDFDFDYLTANVNKLLTDFISSLDYTVNDFLNPPEVMINNGYVGTPYIYTGR